MTTSLILLLAAVLAAGCSTSGPTGMNRDRKSVV